MSGITTEKEHVSIQVNSKDRVRGTISDFAINLSHPITFHQSQKKKYSLPRISMFLNQLLYN